jgi:hypothetical protein
MQHGQRKRGSKLLQAETQIQNAEVVVKAELTNIALGHYISRLHAEAWSTSHNANAEVFIC